jgi:hypothetical protein
LESMSEESISPGSESKLDEVTVVVDDNSMWAEAEIITFSQKHTFPGVQVFSLWAPGDSIWKAPHIKDTSIQFSLTWPAAGGSV